MNKERILLFSVFLLIACKDYNQGNISMNKKRIIDDLNIIQTKRILFGHQSVGNNILNGIKIITEENNFNGLRIDENLNNPKDSNYFLHTKIGMNGNLKSKVDDFCSKVESLAEKKLELAVIKLCYVDIDRNSNIEDLFNYYQDKLNHLSKNYPQIKIITFTVPLTSESTFWQKLKESLTGNKNRNTLDNKARDQFNKLLLSKFPDAFDIAKIESTSPKSQNTADSNGTPFLLPVFSEDGGHLNFYGSKIVAEKFIQYLAKQ